MIFIVKVNKSYYIKISTFYIVSKKNYIYYIYGYVNYYLIENLLKR